MISLAKNMNCYQETSTNLACPSKEFRSPLPNDDYDQENIQERSRMVELSSVFPGYYDAEEQWWKRSKEAFNQVNACKELALDEFA